MSGGHFQYNQHKCGYIADEIQLLIDTNDSQERNFYGDYIGRGYSAAVIERFKEAVVALRKAEVYAQRVDWLVSGDDGPENFLQRLEDDLKKLEEDSSADVVGVYTAEEAQKLLGLTKSQFARAVTAGCIPGDLGSGKGKSRRFSKHVIDTWSKYAREDKNILETIAAVIKRYEEEAQDGLA